MVDGVCTHMKEMLEVGMICPSQSLWSNVVVLVHKKDGGLQFCIDFHKLNVRTKKDSYLLPQIQEVIESLVGTWYFSCLGLKAGSWQIMMNGAFKEYTVFTVGNIGFFECECMQFGLCNAPAMFQRLKQTVCLSWTWPTVWSTCMTCLSFQWQKRSTYIAWMLCSNASGSTTWSSNQWSANSSIMKSTTWFITFPKKVYNPSKENLKVVAEFTLLQIYTKTWAFWA